MRSEETARAVANAVCVASLRTRRKELSGSRSLRACTRLSHASKSSGLRSRRNSDTRRCGSWTVEEDEGM